MHRLTRRQRAEKERKNPPEEEPEFQIAPMIDILLVLLVFFMSISSTEVLNKNKSITLPVAADGKDASKNSPDQVVVNIAWQPLNNIGTIEIGDRKYSTASQVVPVIQKALQANPRARILIRADKAVKWQFMKTVLKAGTQAGADNVTFSVINKDSGGGADDNSAPDDQPQP